MRLELKHLLAYVPFGDMYFIRMEEDYDSTQTPVIPLGTYHEQRTHLNLLTVSSLLRGEYREPLLLLRPMQDLVKEVEINGVMFAPIEELSKHSDGSNHETEYIEHIYDFSEKVHEVDLMQCPYRFIEKLLEWHFDVFGLIEGGLARAITVEK